MRRGERPAYAKLEYCMRCGVYATVPCPTCRYSNAAEWIAAISALIGIAAIITLT